MLWPKYDIRLCGGPPPAGEVAEEFLQGERYVEILEVVEKFVANLPITDIPARYVLFKPLRGVDVAEDDVRSIT